MAQKPGRSCPTCDTPIVSNERFCSNCGTMLEVGANKPTELTPDSPEVLPTYYGGFATETPPPPPPGSFPPPPSQNYMPPAQGYQPPPVGGPPPIYVSPPPKDSSGKVLGQIGCGILAVILVGLALCGGASYFVIRAVTANIDNAAQTTRGSITYGSGSNATPTFAPPTTSPIGAVIKYADVDVTIVDVKKSNGFADENNVSASPAILRIDLSENNPTTSNSNYFYSTMLRLLLPDGTSAQPISSKAIDGPDAAVTRTNWVDFAIASSLDVNKMKLEFGETTEAQIDVPLTSNPDVSKYQPKTATPNKSTQYVGTDWTVLSATEQLSGENKQAPKGQMYVMVKAKLDNNSAETFTAYWGDYVRLQAGDSKAVPSATSTFPLSAAPGQTNQTGTFVFLVPQGTTNFTFLLIATPSTGATQPGSIAFQI